MLVRILFCAVLAGLLAGVATAAVQSFTTTPLILEAETYEGDSHHDETAHLAGTSGDILIASHDDGGGAVDAWAPGDGLERTFYTSVATIGTGVGFALILLSLMVLSGGTITARSGLMWGMAGFAATGLAPALGLSPELPGSAAAALEARQLWWIGTAVATAAGLWLALRISTPIAIGVGLVLILLPHVVGAPHPGAFSSTVPGELSGHFASASLVVQAITWALAGTLAGALWQRASREGGDVATA